MDKLGVIGYGKMSSAIVQGAVRNGAVAEQDLVICSKSSGRERALRDWPNAVHVDNNTVLCDLADAILLGVKPQSIKDLLFDIGDNLEGKLLLSIIAGTSLEQLSNMSNSVPRIFRCMPNLAAQCGESCTLMCKGGMRLSDADRDFADAIFSSIGTTIWIDEEQIDAASAISGSGPAFAAIFVEALADGGVLCGLSRNVANELAIKMLRGSMSTLLASDIQPAQLKDNVCSPGGTSIEGVAMLEQENFRSAIIQAVQAATEKSKNLQKAD